MKKTRKNKARNITKRGRRKKRTGKKWDVKKRSIRTGKKRSIRKKRTGKKRSIRNKRSIRHKQEGGWFDAEDDDEGEVVGQEVAAQKHTQTMKARLNAGIDRDKQERLQIIENNIHPIQFSTDCMVAQNQFKRKEKLTKEANEENDRIEQYLCTKANKHCKFTKQSTKNDCSRFKVPSFLSIFDDSNSDSDETNNKQYMKVQENNCDNTCRSGVADCTKFWCNSDEHMSCQNVKHQRVGCFCQRKGLECVEQ
uniref:Uncharacterized protein n=1 Tax=viral metagenome TaxID=1070528 RepID=A0A6C0BXV9_9ZZZZ